VHPTAYRRIRGWRNSRYAVSSRKGETPLRVTLTERVPPGVVYTTFHHPVTGANIVTTEFSDWATDCPEYKVTAVQVAPASRRTEWQQRVHGEMA